MQTPSQPAPTFSVIIANWNGAKFLPRCLDALASQTFRDFQVIVVDDASTDGSAEGLESQLPNVHVIKLERNLGFAAANNIGARAARGRWLAFLNNDAFPNPDWLGRLHEATQKHPEFAVFASRLVQAEHPDRLDGAGDIYHVSGLAWRRHHDQIAEQTVQQLEQVFSPCGAAALYLREVFMQTGGFDEDFIAYHEDVDLGFRLRLQGFRCIYVPNAVVAHVGSSSYGKDSDFAIYHGHRNLVWTYFKNMPAAMFWFYLPQHLVANVASVVYHSLYGHARAICRAKIDALRHIRGAIRKRRKIQKMRRVPDSEISRWMDHRWLSPYRRKGL